jgi:glycosyltransferase involved in cell wall biosynthesis
MHREPLAEAAKKEGFTVAVAAADGPLAQRVRDLGYQFIPLPIRRFQLTFDDLSLFLCLRQILASGCFDVVHLMTIKPLLFGGLAAATLPVSKRPKVLATVAGLGRAFKFKGLVKKILALGLRYGLGRSAKKITFENPDDRDQYISMRIIDASSSLVLNGAGVDLSIFTVKEKPISSTLNFLFAARLLRSKGVIDFVNAGRILKQKYGQNVRFTVAGLTAYNEPDGLTVEEVEEFSKGPDIDWIVDVPLEMMPDLLARFDVFVLPTSYQEGIPRACIEAGACGLAVIAGNVAGTRYLMEHKRDGLLLTSCDTLAVGKAMEYMILNEPERRMFAKNLRNKIVNGGYSIEFIFDQFIRLYKGS